MNSAVISPCEKYRYVLKRHIPCVLRWVHPCLFVMLNPSTADANLNDPTITKCIGFATRWYCTELTVVNCFAWRATDPKELKGKRGTVPAHCHGPDNTTHVREQLEAHKYGLIVAAWGAKKEANRSPIPNMLRELPIGTVKCLVKNDDGSPKHPLYVKYDKELEDWQ